MPQTVTGTAVQTVGSPIKAHMIDHEALPKEALKPP